jgi:hypothetical protein
MDVLQVAVKKILHFRCYCPSPPFLPLYFCLFLMFSLLPILFERYVCSLYLYLIRSLLCSQNLSLRLFGSCTRGGCVFLRHALEKCTNTMICTFLLPLFPILPPQKCIHPPKPFPLQSSHTSLSLYPSKDVVFTHFSLSLSQQGRRLLLSMILLPFLAFISSSDAQACRPPPLYNPESPCCLPSSPPLPARMPVKACCCIAYYALGEGGREALAKGGERDRERARLCNGCCWLCAG